MSWEREPLFSKAKLFFEKAYQEDKEEFYFGLWCAMGLELLARSAIAKVSPTLLADPDREHQNLLHALNLGSSKSQRKSISTIQVLSLCQTLIKQFTEVEFKTAVAIVNRRNEELHSGGAAFDEYPTQQWIAGFYKCCKILCEWQGESLDSLLGTEIGNEAETILTEIAVEIVSTTKTAINAHKKVFERKDEKVKVKLIEKAKENSDSLATKGHHRLVCPACGCMATVSGNPFGKDNVEHKDGEIIVRQSILPTKFACVACELKLTGYNTLSAAGIGNHYARRTIYTPEEFYDMINPDDYDAIADRYNEISEEGSSWSNE